MWCPLMFSPLFFFWEHPSNHYRSITADTRFRNTLDNIDKTPVHFFLIFFYLFVFRSITASSRFRNTLDNIDMTPVLSGGVCLYGVFGGGQGGGDTERDRERWRETEGIGGDRLTEK